jgi:hypothetical protein
MQAGGALVPVAEWLPSNLSLSRTMATRGNRIVLKYEVFKGNILMLFNKFKCGEIS